MADPASSGGRLWAAFSLRATARSLWSPPARHLRPLDGLRALSILWVVVFHSAWYGRQVLPEASTVRLLLSRWMLPVWRGDFGVDLFFVLSGFLIAGMLLDERAATGSIALGRFYARRLARLWPAMLVVLGLVVLRHPEQASMAWATALYLTNLVPVRFAAMGWTWSLAIEEQFYLVCPWLLRATGGLSPRGRLAALGAVAAGLGGWAALVIAVFDLQPLDAEIVGNASFERWAYAFDLLYDKPWARSGALLTGVAAAVVYRMPGALEGLARARRGTPLALLAGLVTMALATHWPMVHRAPRWQQIAYLATFRTAFGLGFATVVLVALSEHPAGRWLGRRLSSRLLYPIGQLAYAAYLVNPLVIEFVHEALRGRLAQADHPMALLVPADLLATFAAALALHFAVERPFMRMRDLRSPRPAA